MIKVIARDDKGLGDTIARFTDKTGIAYAVKMASQVLGAKDCGCADRQKKLNELIPYGSKEQDSVILREES
jgi:hypothetical protein